MKWKPTTVRAVIVVAIGLVLILGTVWRTYPRQKRLGANLSKMGYMHCPDCQAESRFEEDKLDEPCVKCGSEKQMVPTELSIKEVGTESKYARMAAFVLPEVCVLLTALWFVLRPRHGEAEAFRYMRCANCGQKLRYRAAQVGAPGACSRCKRPFRFPEGAQREIELDGAAAIAEVEEEEEEEHQA
jgi:hypothetical protein